MSRVTEWYDPTISWSHDDAMQAIQRLIERGTPSERFRHLRPAMHIPPEHDDADRILANVIAERDRVRAALAFAASCIKAGEPWTPTCEEIIDGALRGTLPPSGPLTNRDCGDESDARQKGSS